MDLGLKGKSYVVTAASAGLGRAVAEELVAEGAHVVPVARRGEVLDAFAAAHPGQVTRLVADLADPDVPRRAAELAYETYGRLDGAMVSVGGPPRGGVLENSDDEWLAAFASVFLAALRVSRAVIEVGGSDVTLGYVLSTSSKSPLGTMAISNGLRPGLAMLVKQLADELGPLGGRTFGLMPGSIDTERLQALRAGSADPVEAKRAAEAAIPLRRFGEPAEFGRVGAFLLSPAASYVTGCLIPVDGGSMRAL
ncbi:MAG TPA: SDR family oxidoreductase [Propionibacteriaceae bacterium]|nr:SDR family oxidoreductase [Propionibacteriaceae bacterium]